MTKYVEIYPWEVIGELRDGNKVFLLDKQHKVVEDIGDIDVIDYVNIIDLCEKEQSNRFFFWKEVRG